MYIFGGFDGNKLNDVYRINLTTIQEVETGNSNKEEDIWRIPFTKQSLEELPPLKWKKITQKNKSVLFSPRTGHEVVFCKKRLYLFGGTDDIVKIVK